MGDDERGVDDVAAALAILRDAGFPVERIRILPANAAGDAPAAGAARRELTPDERTALLTACRATLEDGQPHAARELLAAVRGQFSLPLTRKDINSVLAREGKIFLSMTARTTPTGCASQPDRDAAVPDDLVRRDWCWPSGVVAGRAGLGAHVMAASGDGARAIFPRHHDG